MLKVCELEKSLKELGIICVSITASGRLSMTNKEQKFPNTFSKSYDSVDCFYLCGERVPTRNIPIERVFVIWISSNIGLTSHTSPYHIFLHIKDFSLIKF